MIDRPRNIANDILDAIESATGKWTKQKKSEERHPGNIRYRSSRMTREPRTTQKEAAWSVMEAAYKARPPRIANKRSALPHPRRVWKNIWFSLFSCSLFHLAEPNVCAVRRETVSRRRHGEIVITTPSRQL